MSKKDTFFIIMFAHACVYDFFFVPLRAFYGFMDELIRHEGIVLSTNDKMAHIQIVQSSACSTCKAKAMCSSSESQAKEMDALMLEPMVSGDRVEVEVREHLAWKAVLLAYVLPFIVMMSVIAVLDLLTHWDEAIVGTVALCSIALYYLALSQFRHRLQKHFTFTARKA